MSEDSSQRKKRSRRDQLTPEQMAQALNAKKSFWPFALAIAVFIALAGVALNPIVMGIGVALTIVAVIGWGLEQH